MAKPFYKHITSILGFFLFALLISSFAFFGAGSIISQPGAIVATVGDQRITVPEFSTTFQNEVTRYREQFGPEFDTQQALRLGLDQFVINQMVQRAALDQETEDLGLLGSSDEVRRVIREMEAFQDITGAFNDFTYRQRLTFGRMSPEDFENTIRVDIARLQLIEAVTQTAIIPQALVDTFYNYRKESRRARIATIPASSISDIAPPDEDTLLAYYELNKSQFAAPEFRDLSFMIVDASMFASNMEFNEEEILAEYDFRYDEFNVPERRLVEIAVMQNENQARQLYDRVQAGEDFSAVATELSGFTAEELSLGEQTRAQIAENYSEVAAERVFTAPMDGITQPTQSLISWQVFHISSIIEGEEQPIEVVRDQIIQLLAEERGIDDLYNAVAAIDDEIASGSSMEQIAVAADVPLIRVPAVSSQGLDPDNNLVDSRVFPYLAQGFALHVEDQLELVPVEGQDVFYMIALNGITPSTPLPFEDVRNQVRISWIAEQQVARARDNANQALADAEAGMSLETIANTYNGVYFQTDAYRRDRVFTQRELAPNVASLMFSLAEGEFGIEADARGDGYLILQVTEIQSQDPANDQFEYQALLNSLSIEMQNDLFIQLQTAIQEDLDVSINQTLIDTIFDPDLQVGFGQIPQ